MEGQDRNVELIQTLGNYGALSERLNQLSQGNKASSERILQIIKQITTAVGKLLENRKDKERQLEECKRNLADTQRELEAAKQRYEEGIRGASETSRVELEKAKAERDSAIEAARVERESAVAAANSEKEEAIRRLTEEKRQEQERLTGDIAERDRRLGELTASGQASSEEAQRLKMEKDKLSLAQQASQAALERDIRLKEEEFNRAKQEANAEYEREKAQAATQASEAQAAAVEARGAKCQEELDAYKARIQAELEKSLANQAAFLEELARVVPVQELQTIIDRLNGLNITLGNDGGAGAGDSEGGIGGLLEGVEDLFGLGGQEQPAAVAVQAPVVQAAAAQPPSYRQLQQRKPPGLPRGSLTRGGRLTRKGKARKYTRKLRGGYQYGKTRTRTRTRTRTANKSKSKTRKIEF